MKSDDCLFILVDGDRLLIGDLLLYAEDDDECINVGREDDGDIRRWSESNVLIAFSNKSFRDLFLAVPSNLRSSNKKCN